jgi:hypothetical protein
MGLRDEKLRDEFFVEVDEAFDYWAGVKIEAIKNGSGLHNSTSRAEYKALQELIKTTVGSKALKKLLVEYGQSNLSSTLTYIDGWTGIKPLELVNAHSRLPIAEGMLSDYFSSFKRSKKVQFNSNE